MLVLVCAMCAHRVVVLIVRPPYPLISAYGMAVSGAKVVIQRVSDREP